MNTRLKQTATGKIKKKSAGPTPAELLARMPKRPLSPEQQLTAIEKVQQQATQRVKLGQQLFEAADAKLKQHQELLSNIQDQQQAIRDQVQDDVAKSLQSYDQWMGKIDESFTNAIKLINERLDRLEMRVDSSRGELESMIEKAVALMGQTQGLMAEAFEEKQSTPSATPDITKYAEASETVYDITPEEGDDGFMQIDGQAQPYAANDASDEYASIQSISDDAQDVTDEMQQSVPEDPFCDINALGLPPITIDTDSIDKQSVVYDVTPEVFEVDVVPQDEVKPQLTEATSDASDQDDDVFGEVLRRLRKQAEEDGFAAA